MIGALIGILFLIVLLGVGWWAIQTLLALIPLAEPFRTILHVVLVLILVVIVLYVITVILNLVGISVPGFGGNAAIHLR